MMPPLALEVLLGFYYWKMPSTDIEAESCSDYTNFLMCIFYMMLFYNEVDDAVSANYDCSFALITALAKIRDLGIINLFLCLKP